MKRSEILLDRPAYSPESPVSLFAALPPPSEVAVPFLVREAEGGVPTGRWLVLDRGREPGRFGSWSWPAVACNSRPNGAVGRLHAKEQSGPRSNP